MLLGLQMPRMGEIMVEGTLHRVLVGPGARVEPGTPLVEVRVDLSAVAEQNCTPVFYFRMVAHEAGWVRDVLGVGDTLAVGATIARVTTTEDEAFEALTPARPLRVNVGVVPCLLVS